MSLKRIFPIIALMLSLGLTACDETLSEKELSVINGDLARITYNLNIDSQTEATSEYLVDALKAIIEQTQDETQRKMDETQSKIDKHNATAAFMGGNMFDLGELFGVPYSERLARKAEQEARKYSDFIDYITSKTEDMDEDVEKIAEIIKSNHNLVNSFYDGSSPISLSAFSGIDGIPSSITAEQFERYKNLELDRANRASWGELLVGTVSNPHYTPLAMLCALVTQIEKLKYPKAVYAVYKEYDEGDGWEVGYDTSQAYMVTFKENGDVLEYAYIPVEFSESYINSKNNMLKKK